MVIGTVHDTIRGNSCDLIVVTPRNLSAGVCGIRELPHNVNIIVGRTITVTWRKSKKIYTCKVIRTYSISSPEIPTQKEARSSKKSNPR